MGCLSSKHEVIVQSKQYVTERTQLQFDPADSYDEVDEHARNAPSSVKKTIEDLVNYLSIPSKQPRMLVRAFFVWISENISYDVDEHFGRSTGTPHDTESVIKHGQSICDGYANVMESLCRQANINVKKISGYAKGIGYRADHRITTNEGTNHTWNAVELEGTWYLIDVTWGAGHVNSQGIFEKRFEDFYFLADPEKLINTHFPYIDNDMKSSMKWQLLKKPVSLDKFVKWVQYCPDAYKLDVSPVSHAQGVIEVFGQFTMTFEMAGNLDVKFTESLMIYEGNTILKEIQNATFGHREGNLYKLQICPPLKGIYDLTLFGTTAGQNVKLPQLFKYMVKCKKALNTDFRYPKAYTQAQTDQCVLHEPLQNNLKPNSEVKVSLSSPVLLRVMINKTFLVKTGNKFDGTVQTGASETQLCVYGSRVDSGPLDGLYRFDVE